jgi:transcriptional regulator with XRE-family HTH domain
MVERIRTLLESRQLTPTQFADVIGVARPIVSHILSGRNKPSLEVVQRILAAMPDLAMPWLLNGTGPMLAASTAAMPMPSAPSGAADVAVAPASAAVSTPVAADEHTQAAVRATVSVSRVPVPGGEHADYQAASGAAPIAAPPRAGTPAPGRARIAPKRFVARASAAPSHALPQVPEATQLLAATIDCPPAVTPGQGTTPGPAVSTPTPKVESSATAAPPAPVSGEETPGAALASALFAGGDKPIRRIVIFYRDGSFADYQPE